METKTPHAQIIETTTWSDCAFCHYFNTSKAMVVSKSLVYVCGRCANELVMAMKEVARKDKRR